MRALLHHAPAVEDADTVGVLDSGKAMRNHHNRMLLRQRFHRLPHQHFRFRVHGGSGLVEHQHRSLAQHRSCDTHALPLPAGQRNAPVAYHMMKTIGQRHHEIVDVSGFGSLLHLGHRSRATQRNIVVYRVMEEHHILRHQRKQTAVVRHPISAHGNAIQQNLTTRNIVETHQQVGESGLARTRRTHQRHRLPFRHRQIHMGEDIGIRIGKGDIVKVNIPSKTLDRQGISRILHIVLYGEKFADTIHGRLATAKISKRRRDIRDRRDDLSEQGDIGNK